MKREKRIRIILAILGIILVGTGVAFNAAAALGNDPNLLTISIVIPPGVHT